MISDGIHWTKVRMEIGAALVLSIVIATPVGYIVVDYLGWISVPNQQLSNVGFWMYRYLVGALLLALTMASIALWDLDK